MVTPGSVEETLGYPYGPNLLSRGLSPPEGCMEDGVMYQVDEQWERRFRDSTLLCTCHGTAGIKCNSKPEGQRAAPLSAGWKIIPLVISSTAGSFPL